MLTGDLDDPTVIDSNVTDGSQLLDDVGVTVLDGYLHDLDIELTRDDVTVCTAVSGTQVCRQVRRPREAPRGILGSGRGG